MHRPIFGVSFVGLVAPILLSVLALNFLKKRKTCMRRNAEDADMGASDSSSAQIETSSDAFSSSIVPIGDCYDVCLSFRGLDTRKVFTDHLYNELVGAGIRVFRDDNDLCQGKEVGPDILAAINNCKILIPILSVNYGSNRCCLDELVQMMESKNSNTRHIVLPIFYKVKPTHVRHQIGSFGEAFRACVRRFDPAILEKWKTALVEVSSLKGWETNGYETDLVKLIVQKVLSELKKEFELVVPEILVGIESHVEKVMEFLNNNSSSTLFLGIHGMGGIGKTTLAKTIYNKLSDQFKYRSLIADIRESCKHNGVKLLQNQLIYDISKQEDQVNDIDDGTKFISSKFRSRKVLILLDDVDDADQLKALVGNHDWFSSGSRIIITTRNRHILYNGGVDYMYEHEVMDMNQSLIMFCRHAFRRDSPPRDFEDLTRDVVSTTGGLPLSLEVLASLLCGKKLAFWRGVIEKLKKVPHKKVQDKLLISYEALNYEEQQIFLDIACFFNGTDGRITSYMWNACGFFPEEGIEVLRSLSLIKVGDNHELIMHDQLRDLGREIVRQENLQEPWYRSRLWDSMEASKVLEGNKGTEKIEAIYLSKDRLEGFNRTVDQGGGIYTDKQFKNLPHLRFLHISGAHLRGDFKDSLKKLRWFQWHNCPSTFEAKNFHLKELIVLDLSRSKISDKWQGWSFIMMAEKLKYLNLTSCQCIRSTVFLSAFKNLEVLILRDCEEVGQIDSSIRNMKSLVHLDLTRCRRLEELPAELGELDSLEQLLLKDSPNISVLPDNIEALQNLEILNVCGTGIKQLPNSTERLRNLRDLDASSCKKLRGGIPKSMRNLSYLQRLDFAGCKNLEFLPELPSSLIYLSITCRSRKLPSLSHLTHLKELHLLDCNFLKSISELPSTLLEPSECSQLTDIEEPELPKSLNTKLEILKIQRCEFMETLDVSQLNHLRTLTVDCCNNILEVRGLDKLKYMENLTITSCVIKRLDFPKSVDMKISHVRDCFKLIEIQGLNKLKFLEELDISGCISIERLDLSNSVDLKLLNAENCENLIEIQGLDQLELLKELRISQCASIEWLGLPKSGRLKILDAQNCESLVEIRGLNRLEFLEELNISMCASIEMLDLPKSGFLNKLYATKCENLIEFQGLARLEFLEELYISGCVLIESLDLPYFQSLKKLDAENCVNLVEIQGLSRLEFLVVLNIFGCSSIERLDLPISKSLKILDVGNCENLVQIQGLDRLEFLEELCISGCALIKRLDLSKSKSLKILDAKNCTNLVEIQGLNRLEFIRELNISGCTSLERLDLSTCEVLKILDAQCCSILVGIQGLFRLEFLEELNISGCTSIERLDIPKSMSMKKLDAKNCINLVEIEGLNRLEFLEVLNISECTSIEKLEIPKSKHLKKLNAENCRNLVNIQGLNRLEFLAELCISGCALIERVDLLKSESLRTLAAQYCKNLVEIQGLDRLEFLEVLNISGCASIEKLELPKSVNMKTLDVETCKNLVEIQGLDKLESLEVLNISWCASIERLDLPNSESLKNLYAQNCKDLVEIRDLDKLEFLEVLDISGCASIIRLNLPKSRCLKILCAENCENLVEFQGLHRLEFLEVLNVSGCVSIERLNISKSKGLKILCAENCENLVEIQGLDRVEFLEVLDISGCTLVERVNLPKSLKKLYSQNSKNSVEIQDFDRVEFSGKLE